MSESGEGAPQPVVTERQQRRARDLAASVVLTERGATAPPLTDIDQRSIKKAKEHKAMNEINKSLEDLTETHGEIGAKLRGRLEDFGTTRNANHDKTRPGDEGVRFHAAEASVKKIADVLEKGYDQLSTTERTALVTELSSVFMTHSVLGPEFARLTPAQQTANIEKQLRNPEFAKNLATVADRLVEMKFTGETEIRGAHKTHLESARSETIARDVVNRREAAVNRTDTKLADIAAGNLPNTPQLAAAEQNRLNAEQARTQARQAHDGAVQQLNRAEDHLRTLQAAHQPQVHPQWGYVMQSPTIAAAEQAVQQARQREAAAKNTKDNAERDFSNAANAVISLQANQQTEGLEEHLETTLEERQNKLDEARLAQAGAREDTVSKFIQERETVQKRKSEEEAFNRLADQALVSAMRQTINDELRDAITIQETQAGGIQKAEFANIQSAVNSALEARWRRQVNRKRGIFKRKTTETVDNQEQIDQDFNNLLANGPSADMRAILTRLRVRPPGVDVGPTSRLTPDQIDEVLADKDFKQDMSDKYVKQVLSRRILTRGIRPGELHQVINTSWGKDMIQAAIDHNTDFKNKLAQVEGSGDMDLDKPEFRQLLSREAANNPLWLLGGFFPAIWKALTYDERAHMRDQMAA